MKKPKLTQYGIWETDEDSELGYWMLFDTMDDALEYDGRATSDIYRLHASYQGRYKRGAIYVGHKPKKGAK